MANRSRLAVLPVPLMLEGRMPENGCNGDAMAFKQSVNMNEEVLGDFTVTFIPDNEEYRTISGNHVFVFAPDNKSVIDIVAGDIESVANSSENVSISNSRASAETFVFAPGNKGTIHTSSTANSEAVADAIGI